MNSFKQNHPDYVGLIIFSFPVFSIFFVEYFIGYTTFTFLITSFILITGLVICYFKRRLIFSETLFFTLIHILFPLRKLLISTTGLSFAGVNYIAPILIFIMILIAFPKLRKSLLWIKLENIDSTSIKLILVFGLVSALALFVWGKFFASNLYLYTSNLPNGSLLEILALGIAFALFNSSVEEILSRGFLWSGLEKLITNRYLVLFIQALIFGLFHKNGFPSGVTGVIMVFCYSIMLGLIRFRTKGILAVVTCHFISDLAIFGILYLLR